METEYLQSRWVTSGSRMEPEEAEGHHAQCIRSGSLNFYDNGSAEAFQLRDCERDDEVKLLSSDSK
jgi:hypothetical protein